MTDKFTLDLLIKSIKDLRNRELADQLRGALAQANLGLDKDAVAELIHELEHDLEEHITRLERMQAAMTPEEREQPEHMDLLRKQAVAYASQTDLEEIETLCEAFARAREMMVNLTENGKVQFDVKLLFNNLGGIVGLDIGRRAEGETPADNGQPMPQFLQRLLQNGLKNRAPKRDEVASKPAPFEDTLNGPSFEDMFDTRQVATPKNRLPRDFRKA
ncbi:MAG: hypothetical protein IT462_00450 [Planctomycetes bacterium]|nr:hypothetical protein [Planctomycetota bacterium]